MSKKILLIGGGGHCKTVIEAVESNHTYDEIGIIDLPENLGKLILNCKIIGTDRDLKQLKKDGFDQAFISLGSIGDPAKRLAMHKLLKDLNFSLPVIIDKTANVSLYAKISEGTFIGKNVIINSDTLIGKCVIVNTGCLIEHDCVIGDFSHIAPGAVLCGNVNVGKETHIGASSVIRQNIAVGEKSTIGVGSVVVKNIKSNSLAFGNPCQEVEVK